MPSQLARNSRKFGVALWTVQTLLALLFLFAGGMKLVAPFEMLKGPVAFPELFIRFIGVCEFLGGLGVILPAALRIRTELTPLAAAGLVIIMIGATVTTIVGGMGGAAVVPAIVGALAATVAYTRWRVVPVRGVARSIRFTRQAPQRLRVG
jgi:uncharacterized membrane protein YphA (DoxX/SURF4 family)